MSSFVGNRPEVSSESPIRIALQTPAYGGILRQQRGARWRERLWRERRQQHCKAGGYFRSWENTRMLQAPADSHGGVLGGIPAGPVWPLGPEALLLQTALSQPNSTAGISYLKTGVCHQAANRILHPAGVTVAGCQTFGVSQMIFGVYGKGAWPELSNCYPPGASVAQVRSAKPMSKARNLSERVGVYNSMVSSMVSTNHNTGVSAEAVELDELSALVEMGLGHPLDPPTLNALFVIQTA